MTTPPFTIQVEPHLGGTVQCLRCAPGQTGGAERWLVNVTVWITSADTIDRRVNRIELRTPQGTKEWSTNVRVPDGGIATWISPDDFVLTARPTQLTVAVHTTEHTDPKLQSFAIVEHRAPTSGGSYDFWGNLADLRPGEYWDVHGTRHGNTAEQAYAYDVGVGAPSGGGSTGLLPGTSGTQNDDFRIWGTPIRAIADGEVVQFLNDFPTNHAPFTQAQIDAGASPPDLWPDLKPRFDATPHGNGNFFTVRSQLPGGEAVHVLYAHLQAGSLNPALMQAGQAVKRGDFLGLAGNSGNSSAPHLHIGVVRADSAATSWLGPGRPMPFVDAHAVAWSVMGASPVAAPWVKLAGRGVPTATEGCAVWPSDHPVFKRRQIEVKHHAVSASGQVWVVRTDGRVLSSPDKLHRRRSSSNQVAPPEQAIPAPGLWFNIDPNGSAREVCVVDEQPFLIGGDGRLWRGLASGFNGVAGSPELLRICADHANNKVWCVEADHRVSSFSTATGVWTRHPGDGWAADLCVAGGVPYVIGQDRRIYRSAGTGGWSLFSTGEGKRIAADLETGAMAVIGNDDHVYRYQAGNWNEHPGGGTGRELAFFGDLLVLIGGDHGLWRSVGAQGWRRLNAIEAG